MSNEGRRESDVEAEIAAIHARLAALASKPAHGGVAPELGAIRAQLQELAKSNAEVGARLGHLLDDHAPDDAA